MNTQQKTNWWIDLTLFAGFIVTFFLDLTGVEVHQWIGIFAGALAAYHLFTHSDWVDAVGRRFFSGTAGRARLYYVLDTMLLVGFALIIATGLIISTWLNLSLGNFAAWLNIHIIISIATLVTLLVKLALHWRWIARAAQDAWPQPDVAPARTPALQPVKVNSSRMGRREFLQVMSVVSVASFFALVNASKGLSETSATTVKTDVATQSTQDINTTTSSSSSSSSSSSACAVQCGKRCSYPGHCHRYTDSNNNNRCDLGECL